MVTLSISNSVTNADLTVMRIKLEQDTPFGVIARIVEADGRQKPPTGTIWIMRMRIGQANVHELDQFATFVANNVDEHTLYELIPAR